MQAEDIIGNVAGLLVFILLAWLSYRWLLPLLGCWLPRRPCNLMLLCVMILFGFGGLLQYTGLGIIVGAIPAGVLTRPVFDKIGAAASFTAITVPLGFALLLRRWGEQLTTPQSDIM